MAFARFGADSGVYIFERSDRIIDGEHVKACWNCALLIGSGEHHFETTSLGLMISHVEQHRKAGHRIPEHLIEILANEWESEEV